MAVLAAGQSRRFGSADKLAAQFRGAMLGLHVCRTLAPLPFARRWMIASDAAHACARHWREAGFEVIPNAAARTGMGSSVALAAQLAQEAGSGALLIALADMPLVPATHFAELIQHAVADALIASTNGSSPMPPALFGSMHFAQLTQAEGDSGARSLLAAAKLVPCDASLMIDIDDEASLARYS